MESQVSDKLQSADRLIALWKSGRDKYRSFFSVLNEVRREIGDEALADWCRNELHIGLSIIHNAAGFLTRTETIAVQKEMEAAIRLERQRVKRERELERKYRLGLKKSSKYNKALSIVRSHIEQKKSINVKDLIKEYPRIKATTFKNAIQATKEF
jgi:hypothetical protein